jgi:hypothetical protein
MAEKKSIIEEAIADIKKIQEALAANTKEILRSAAREEIDSVVKESLISEDDFEEEDIEKSDDADGMPEDGEPEVEKDDIEIGGEDEPKDDIEISKEVEPETDVQDLDMDADASFGDEMDMTDASDDDVIAIYKKLSGNDQIEIVGDEIHLNVEEPGEYVIKTDEAGTEATPDEFGDDDFGGEQPAEDDDLEVVTDEPDEFGAEGTEDEEKIYEIEMENEDKEDEEKIDEAIPVGLAQSKRLPGKVDIGQPRGAGAKNEGKAPVKTITESEVKYSKLLTESTKLKAENDEFRKALTKFRTMLVETVVFNSNLTYVAKLFMEHSTTKDEKKNIMLRFDESVSNLPESKKLYKTIANELKTRKPINESIDNKITNTVTTGTSKQLNESTAYVDKETKRIIDLMNRVENK